MWNWILNMLIFIKKSFLERNFLQYKYQYSFHFSRQGILKNYCIDEDVINKII
jgi:hypothetical protein